MSEKPRLPFSVKKHIDSFRYAFRGLRRLWYYEHNFRIELVLAGMVVLLGGYVGLSLSEWALVLFCIGLVIIAELFNTALEYLCDYLSPEYHRKIGWIKDFSAAAVLIAALLSVFIGALVFIPRMF